MKMFGLSVERFVHCVFKDGSSKLVRCHPELDKGVNPEYKTKPVKILELNFKPEIRGKLAKRDAAWRKRRRKMPRR